MCMYIYIYILSFEESAIYISILYLGEKVCENHAQARLNVLERKILARVCAAVCAEFGLKEKEKIYRFFFPE